MLENFDFHVPWEDLSGGGEFSFHDLALCHLPSLQLVNIYLGGKQNVSEEMVTKVEDALRQQADAHPNHPSISKGHRVLLQL